MTSTPLRRTEPAHAGPALHHEIPSAPGSAEHPTAARRGLFHRHDHGWASPYSHNLWWSDAIVVSLAVIVAYFLRFGIEPQGIAIMHRNVPLVLVTVTLGAIWVGCLRLTNSYDPRVFGAGTDEYSRVARASFWLFGGLAIVEVLFRPEIARGFEAIALPLGSVGLLVTRWFWRRRLSARRSRGEALERLLIVGSVDSSSALAERLSATPAFGYTVVGLCARPERALGHAESDPTNKLGVPIVGDWDSVSNAVKTSGATTVAVTAANMLGPTMMQALCWELDELDVRLFVAPGLVDVSGPRVLMRPMAGLPLLHISRPQYKNSVRLWKAISDRLGAAVLLLALSPVLLAVAVAIKLDSRGPVFYRATRIGYQNEPFRMWKFRSMVVDADARRAALAGSDDGNGVLFKVRDDPRVTRVGKWIRRYSLDEFPQLFNVLSGDMSIVGPRPPLTEEVEKYDGRVSRRMLVKPGMTGLWQVSGRSDLTWEESVRLDLYYVENWSLMQDLAILWRTARAVLSSDGAY
ncbi:sugar transferase [Dietzia sp. UBA5065]|uniref:sugar transferase n=1 Tax=Dietzia sp. UBA5065 TaxID=1946422 RepID=UPI0025C5193D|nr:sugar transferase [Dietzia sp. UBA5065]